MKTIIRLKTNSEQIPSLTSGHSPNRLGKGAHQRGSPAADIPRRLSVVPNSSTLGHNFGVLQLHSNNLPEISQPGDSDEQAADRTADAVTREAEREASSHARTLETNWNSTSRSNGLPLEATTLNFMQARFGHDFTKVRIHADHEAAQQAQSLNARAFTIGNSISFGTGEYNPRSGAGRHLLAHELAHVVQQSRQPHRKVLHRRLMLTGTTANINRALAILNGALIGFTVSVDSAGFVSIARNNVAGPPTPEQVSLQNHLNTVLVNPQTVTIAVESGTTTLVGSWPRHTIDVADMETMGTGPGGSVATLIHEIVEQYQGQMLGAGFGSETTGAHGAGMAAESTVIGARRGAQRTISQSVNADGTINAVFEVPWTYPNGTIVIVTTTIVSNNVTNVTRR